MDSSSIDQPRAAAEGLQPQAVSGRRAGTRSMDACVARPACLCVAMQCSCLNSSAVAVLILLPTASLRRHCVHRAKCRGAGDNRSAASLHQRPPPQRIALAACTSLASGLMGPHGTVH